MLLATRIVLLQHMSLIPTTVGIVVFIVVVVFPRVFRSVEAVPNVQEDQFTFAVKYVGYVAGYNMVSCV
jgi:hypothetical protein